MKQFSVILIVCLMAGLAFGALQLCGSLNMEDCEPSLTINSKPGTDSKPIIRIHREVKEDSNDIVDALKILIHDLEGQKTQQNKSDNTIGNDGNFNDAKNIINIVSKQTENKKEE